MGKIQDKVDRAFNKLIEDGDFEEFISRLIHITDYSVRFKWQFYYLNEAVNNNLDRIDMADILSDELKAKRLANSL